ncbi:hypothetical protein GLYMA_01G153934v4 [Glycine max]|nr:hypothetical protein GLYMA_01G153934v4 [Glycine max]KAH1163245.1 hypothetical protein GYH30_001671 [Glycine max]
MLVGAFVYLPLCLGQFSPHLTTLSPSQSFQTYVIKDVHISGISMTQFNPFILN